MWFCCVICPKGSEGQSEESQCSSVGPEWALPYRLRHAHCPPHQTSTPPAVPSPPIPAAGNPSGLALALGVEGT